MRDAINELGKKGLALVILLVAAYVLFKVVIGVVAAVAWIVVIVVALVAMVWAYTVLRR